MKPKPPACAREKLIIFTGHRDTLEYLSGKIQSLIGNDTSVVSIFGGMERLSLSENEGANQEADTVILCEVDAGSGQKGHVKTASESNGGKAATITTYLKHNFKNTPDFALESPVFDIAALKRCLKQRPDSVEAVSRKGGFCRFQRAEGLQPPICIPSKKNKPASTKLHVLLE